MTVFEKIIHRLNFAIGNACIRVVKSICDDFFASNLPPK